MYESNDYELKKYFNTSGVKYRELGVKDIINDASEEELLKLLSSDGKLIKRPLLLRDNKEVLIGFKEDIWKEKLL